MSEESMLRSMRVWNTPADLWHLIGCGVLLH